MTWTLGMMAMVPSTDSFVPCTWQNSGALAALELGLAGADGMAGGASRGSRSAQARGVDHLLSRKRSNRSWNWSYARRG